MNSSSIPVKLLETSAKIFNENKWKKRYIILEKCLDGSLSLGIFKTAKCSRKSRPKKPVLIGDGFYGLESGFPIDNHRYTLAIICYAGVTVVSFRNQSTLGNWEWTIRNAFGYGFQYSLFALELPDSLSAIVNTYIRLHLRNGRFCLVTGSPPRLAANFRSDQIRRFGSFENKFCMEAGSNSEAWAGLYVFRTGHCEKLATAFRLASRKCLHEYLAIGNEKNAVNVDWMSSELLIELDEPADVVVPVSTSPPLNYVKIACRNDTNSARESGGSSCCNSQELLMPKIIPNSFRQMSKDVAANDGDAVEYAQIDKVATQAARKMTKSRKEWLSLSGWRSSTRFDRVSSIKSDRKDGDPKPFLLFRRHLPQTKTYKRL